MMEHVSNYLIELSLVEIALNKWLPSLIASSAIFTSHILLTQKPSWSQFMVTQTGHSEANLKMCAKDLVLCLGMAKDKRHFKSIFKKYGTSEKEFASEVCVEILERGSEERREEESVR
jgi:Cyclin, C-terminal domain